MTAIGVKTAYADQVNIDVAIGRVAEGLAVNIQRGARVAVLAMQSDFERMSDYLIDETITALTMLQGGRGFTTINRAQFEQLMGGLQIDTTGIVGDATIQAAGRVLNVRYIITGTFEPLAGFFRFRAQLIDVQTLAVRGIHTANIQNDSLVAYLTGGRPAPVAGPVSPPAQARAANVQQLNIDAAVHSVAERLSVNIESGTSIAVLAIQAASVRVSDYLIAETIRALIDLQGERGFTTLTADQAERLLRGRLYFSRLEPVSAATVRMAGRVMEVRYIATGTFEPVSNFFRFRLQLLDAGTGTVLHTHTADVQNDSLVAYLTGSTPARPAARTASPASPASPALRTTEVGYFTIGQRWGTWFLNGLIPGVGSFVIMNDRFGGWFR